MKDALSEQQLVKLLKKKDRAGVQEAYERYSPILLSVCKRYFNDHELAKDAMHEGFIKALNAIASFKEDGSFEGWLKRIVVNHSLDLIKKEAKHQHETIEDVQLEGEEINESKTIDKQDVNEKIANVDFVRDADLSSSEILTEIQNLPQMYCIVFVLFVLEEFSHAEIATQLNIDEKASRTRLARARKMLKEALYKKSIAVLTK